MKFTLLKSFYCEVHFVNTLASIPNIHMFKSLTVYAAYRYTSIMILATLDTYSSHIVGSTDNGIRQSECFTPVGSFSPGNGNLEEIS